MNIYFYYKGKRISKQNLYKKIGKDEVGHHINAFKSALKDYDLDSMRFIDGTELKIKRRGFKK